MFVNDKLYLPINSLVVFLPLKVKGHVGRSIEQVKKSLHKEPLTKQHINNDGLTHLLFSMNNLLDRAGNSVNKCGAGIYVSSDEQRICYLPYPVKTAIFFNKKLSVTTLLDAERRNNKTFVVIALSEWYATIYESQNNLLTTVSRLSITNNHAYVADIDKFLGILLPQKIMPLFVIGNNEAVDGFCTRTAWIFNIVDSSITGNTLTDDYVKRIVSKWTDYRLILEKHDQDHLQT